MGEMHIFKTKKIVFLVVILLIISVVILLSLSSCNINSGSIAKKGGTGAISLLDSLGVGDVPDYPGSKLDVDLYRSINSVLGKLPELPATFSSTIFFTHTTKSSPEDVRAYYIEQMKSLGWELTETFDYGNQGSFTAWRKMANTGKYVTYGIFAGNFKNNNKTVTLILNGANVNEIVTDL